MKMHHHANRTALAVLGLAVATSSGAFGQFSAVSSRAAMNANDSLTWNRLGDHAAIVSLPFATTSDRNVQVTGTQTGATFLNVLVASWSGLGFGKDDVVLYFPLKETVTLTFNPPVTAVGVDVNAGPSEEAVSTNARMRAYRGETQLGSTSAAMINLGWYKSEAFLGARDEGGISRVEIDMPACYFWCRSVLMNQLSLVTPQRVAVEVKPGADKSVLVADSNAKLPFAILSSAGFDASTAVDVSSLRFGRTGTEASVLSCAGGVDVNYDFLPDLTCQFSVKAGAFVTGDLTAKLKGKLTNGVPIYGTADVIVK